MRFLAAALQAALLFPVVHGHFVTSLHSNYVVNLDFEGDARHKLAIGADGDASQPGEAVDGEGDVKVMAFAGGKRKFRCQLPSIRNRTVAGSRSADVSKSKQHFINAKLVNLRGSCWKLKKEYWTYDVCFGRKVVQYRSDADTRFSLGDFKAGSDELLPNGGVRELYVDGTDNRTSEIRYVCGSSEASSKTFAVEEPSPLYYVWTVSGPQFCAWRENDGAQARDTEGNIFLVSSLLEDMRNTCTNITQGWWTYEYCFPHSLTQYHLSNSGNVRDPLHVLGTLNGTDANLGVNRVDMTMVKLKPSISPRERRAPPSNHRTLRQRLGGGTVCDETNRPRATTMHFQCPLNWQSKPETRIISINEGSLCEYEMVVQTTLLCGHEKFLPTLPRGQETIQCVVEPGT